MDRRHFAKSLLALPAVAAIPSFSVKVQNGRWDDVLFVCLDLPEDHGLSDEELKEIGDELRGVIRGESGRDIPLFKSSGGTKLVVYSSNSSADVETILEKIA
jgi:hypothetical protein